MAKKGLGKGLGAIFGEDVISREEEEHKIRESARKKGTSDPGNTAQEDGTAGEQMVKVALIEPNQSQPRKKFDQEQMEELAESIKLHGVLQPLLVQKKDGLYEIIAGERRWRAAKLAGLKEVPVVIRQYTPQESMEVALIENLQREDLNPIEEAKAYQRLIQEFGLKQEEIAAKVAKNRTTITNAMRLLKLDEGIQNMVIENVISSGHARALLGLEDPEMQLKAAKMIMEDKLSVRETERLVKRLIREAEEKDKPKKQEKNINFIYQNLEERMKTVMGTKVTIHNKDKNKGRIEIEYYSEAELERIVEMIESIR
ncbi:MAG: ParB/RepB/Spo0J family partition protein [Lachnospiraceae bacterium]|nr:ParB/RepB/Spo0J family partition protein [Lachnospiraceae bacterium]